MAKVLKAYLVFRAHDQNLRIVRTQPQLDWDEIYFAVTVTVPEPWGRFAGAIEVELPEGGPALIGVQLVEPPQEE